MQPLISAGSVDTYLEITAWLLALFILGVLAVSIAVLKYRGIGHDQRRHLYRIRPQLMEARPETVTIRESDTLSTVTARVREELTGKDALGDEPTPREAALAVVATVRAALPNVPRLAIRGGVEGVVLLAAGLVTWASLAWVDWVRDAGTGPVPGREFAGVVLGVLPYWDTVGAVAVAAVVLGWQLLVEAWFVFGLALVIGAVLLVTVDRRTEEDLSVTLYPDRGIVVLAVVAATSIIYVVAALPNLLLRSIGYADIGAVVGAAFGSVALLWALGLGVDNLRHTLIRRQSDPYSNPQAAALYLLSRKMFGLVALLSIPLTLYFVWQALSRVWPYATANPRVAGAVVVFGVALIVAVLYLLFQDVTATLFDALMRWVRSVQVRAFLFSRGIPVTAVALTFLTAWAFGLQTSFGGVPILSSLAGLAPTLTLALLVGAVVRLITLGWAAAKYRFIRFEDPKGRSSVPVALYPPIEDANGDVLYVARVGSHELAHRDPDALARDIETVVEAKLDEKRFLGRVFYGKVSENIPVTFSRYYWEQDLRFGTVDIDQVAQELHGDVTSRMLATIAEHDGVEYEVIDDELARLYPEDAVERAKAQEMRLGNISRQDGEYVLHR